MVHIDWVIKYRYPVLQGNIQKRCRELVMQVCRNLSNKDLGRVILE